MSEPRRTADVFSDFCQAWGARFPGSDLPDAWEEDVRANLKKHRTKVAILREELEKEEMYVEYLQTLLKDIEKKKSKKEATADSLITLDANKQEFLDSHLSDLKKTDAFVTVINVSSLKDEAEDAPKDKSKQKRDSLRSVSSPTTPPTSPLISSSNEDFISREGLAIVNSSSISSSTSDEEAKEEEPSVAELEDDGIFRGQPDGRDGGAEEDSAASAKKRPSSFKEDEASNRASVRQLMANWEGRPPVQAKPVASRRSKLPLLNSASESSPPTAATASALTVRKDSDSSSRGRMGSPSGKSHDSSDSEHNSWSRPDKPSRLASGEIRLDRLVRKPSGEKRMKPRIVQSDHLYDTVAADEDLDEVYDNHLLYEKKTDTIRSGGNSSADLGFDEPPIPARRTGTLSSTSDTTSSRRTLEPDEMEEEETYVNIQYFLQKRRNTGDSVLDSPLPKTNYAAFNSDDEIDEVLEEEPQAEPKPTKRQMTDELPVAPVVTATAASVASVDSEQPSSSSISESGSVMYKCILTSILESEAIYLEALSVMLQYMKAMKVTLSTDQPFIPKEDFEVIFYKVPELHDLHLAFHESLKKLVDRWDDDHSSICHPFKMLASRTKIYVAYLNNYQRALESLHRCSEAYSSFADLTRSIKLRSVKGQRQGQSLSLEDLLHKPVGRIQKQCLCLQDLISATPVDHPDHRSLSEALSTFQDLVTDYNTRHANELFPHQERPQRHLVKNSFIVELAEGQRKLRHLFLFNDVLVCAKYKASGGGHHPPAGGVVVGRNQEKFTFQLKWYIPLEHALIVEEPSSEPRESHPANLVSLRTQAASLRDQILRIEKEEEVKGTLNNRRTSNGSSTLNHLKATEKPRKKLAEVEAQLVLASPSLVFQVSNKQGKAYSFFLSSEYERSQWVETLQVLQSSLPSNHTTSAQAKNMSMYELQAWITSCRKFLKTNMGSFLMRSPRDEPLLVGDLQFKIHTLQGLTRPSDLFVVVEVDSYGHFFRKCKTQLVHNTLEPRWEEEFTIDLEGSENLRILVYEQTSGSTSVLRGRAQLELSRTWLTENMNEQRISMNDVVLVASMKFVTFEQTMRRVPSNSKASSGGLFGANIGIVSKRERRPVPFIITACVREVEKRGISEVGIYRVSGSAADVTRLKKAFEANPYEAEQLLKEVDIHSVAGTLKSYLRDLPESLVTTPIYQKMFEAFSTIHDSEAKKNALLGYFSQVPIKPNQACVVFLIEHIVKVSQYEQTNKMSLHNLATVFGPTMLHSGSERDKFNKKSSKSEPSQFTTGTVDVMAQAGILHFFLTRRARGESIQVVERSV